MTESKQIYERSEELLASVLGLALHVLETLCFNRKNPQQLYSVCLYARLLELATACKALLEKNSMVGIPILLRSLFEADIDLTNLMKCPDYYRRMYASFLEQKLRLTKEAASSRPNPFLAEIRAHSEAGVGKLSSCHIQTVQGRYSLFTHVYLADITYSDKIHW